MRPWRERRFGILALLCALVAGPTGVGTAVHVARADLLDAPAAVAASIDAAGSHGQHPAHQGPSCAICQVLDGARGIVPAVTALPVAARVTFTRTVPPPVHGSEAFVPAVAGRSPPRAS